MSFYSNFSLGIFHSYWRKKVASLKTAKMSYDYQKVAERLTMRAKKEVHVEWMCSSVYQQVILWNTAISRFLLALNAIFSITAVAASNVNETYYRICCVCKNMSLGDFIYSPQIFISTATLLKLCIRMKQKSIVMFCALKVLKFLIWKFHAIKFGLKIKRLVIYSLPIASDILFVFWAIFKRMASLDSWNTR